MFQMTFCEFVNNFIFECDSTHRCTYVIIIISVLYTYNINTLKTIRIEKD